MEIIPKKCVDFRLRNICHSYGYRQILKNISLQILGGQIVVLCGANGSGKSTLLHIITRIALPQHGDIFWQDRWLQQQSEKQKFLKQCAYLATENLLFPELSLEQNIRFILKIRGQPSKPWANSVRRILKDFQMYPYLRQNLQTVSSGMMRRAYLSVVFSQDTEMIIMDEPFLYLDRAGRSALLKTMARHKKMGKIILFTAQEAPVDQDIDRIFEIKDKEIRLLPLVARC